MYSRSYLSAWPYKEHLELIDLFKLIFFFTSLCVWWSLLKSSSGFSVACAEWPLFKLVLLGYADLQCCASFSVQWSESVIQDICCCSVAQSCPTLCNPMDCSKPGFPVFYCLWSLFKLMSIESEMPSNHLTLCRPLLLLPSVFPSIRVFSSELALCIRWPKYWSFSFSISPSDEYSGKWFPLGLTGLISLMSKGLSRVSSSTTIWKHQFFSTQPFLRSNSHICT